MHPMGIAKGEKWPNLGDDLYVVDTGNRRIVLVHVEYPDTSYIYYNLPQTSYPRSARTDYFLSLWVTEMNQCQLLKFDWRLDLLTTLGSKGTGPNQFLFPIDFTFARGYGNSFLTERWTKNSGGQLFLPGTDILDFTAVPNSDYTLVYYEFTLTECSRVIIKVYDDYGSLVRTLEGEPGAFMYPARKSKIWDCLDNNGDRVPPGKYEIRITATACYTNGYTKTVSTEVDLSFKIMDFYCEPQAIDVSEEETYITFDLNYDADVTIKIYENNNLVRIVIQDSFFEHGENSVIWDGKDDNERLVLPEGNYHINIHAKEVAFGNVVEGNIPMTIKGTVVEEARLSGQWEKENSPYVICGSQKNKSIDYDDSLKILAGSKVMFWPYDDTKFSIIVGTGENIKAMGDENDRILISSYKKLSEREKGDWKTIRVMGQKAIFKYCDIEYGGTPYLLYHPANLVIESSSGDSIILSHCKISNSDAYGVTSDNDKAVIENNEFASNDSFPLYIKKTNGVGKTNNNTFTDNEYQTIKVGSGVVSDDAVWTDQGIPYLISWSFSIS